MHERMKVVRDAWNNKRNHAIMHECMNERIKDITA